jgi:hypothetical protein
VQVARVSEESGKFGKMVERVQDTDGMREKKRTRRRRERETGMSAKKWKD